MCATRPVGWKPNGSTAPVAVLTLARLRTAVPFTEVNEPPRSTYVLSTPQATVSTRPLTLGFHPLTFRVPVAGNAKALLRVINALEFGFFTRLNSPSASMVPPHWTICRTLSTEPSVPEVPSCGVAADVVDTDAFATPPASASDHIKAADSTATIVLRITSPPVGQGGRAPPAG